MRRLLFAFALPVWVLYAQDDGLPARAVKVLEQRCWGCHGASLAQSGLRLDSREAILHGGTRGPAIVAGDTAQSLLVRAIRRTGEPSMPPGPKLADPEIAAIESWIAAGAPWPKTTPQGPTAQTWWSFQKPIRPRVPLLTPWARTAIDAFIAAKLDEQKLKPAKEADRRTLIRRAYLDLHGLPPTAEQVEKFVADAAPNAYE